MLASRGDAYRALPAPDERLRAAAEARARDRARPRSGAAARDPRQLRTAPRRRANPWRAGGSAPSCAELRAAPIALEVEKANEQHYEVPVDFFRLVLGPRLKYSCCLWPDGVAALAEAEDAMLELTCERAGDRGRDGDPRPRLRLGLAELLARRAVSRPRKVLAVSNSRAPAAIDRGRGTTSRSRGNRTSSDRRRRQRLRARSPLRSRASRSRCWSTRATTRSSCAASLVARAGRPALRARLLAPSLRVSRTAPAGSRATSSRRGRCRRDDLLPSLADGLRARGALAP